MALETNVTILAIDDEEPVRQSIVGFLEDCNYRVLGAESGREGLKIFHDKQPDLVLVDLRMPEMDGLEVLEAVRYVSPETPIIVVSGMGIIADAVEALRLGAWDYVIKPIQDMEILRHAIEKALERAQLIRENRRYREHLESEVGKRTRELELANKEMAEINKRLHKVVETTMDISICSGFENFGSQLLEEFGRHMLASGGSLYMLKKEGLHLVHALDPGHAPDFIPFPLSEDSVLKVALETSKPVLIRDIETPNNFSTSGWSGYRGGSVLVFPLPDENGNTQSVLSLHSKTQSPFLEQDKEIGAVLASYSSEAMRAAKATKALRESEETFRAISSSVQDAIIMIDNLGKISFWNEAAETIFGYSQNEALGQNLHTLIAPERFHEEYRKALPRFETTDKSEAMGGRIELIATKKDGLEFPIDLSLSSIRLHDKWHGVGIIRDITQQKQAEKALRESEENLSITLKSIGDAVISTDTNGCVVRMNPTAEKLTGWPEQEACGKPLTEVLRIINSDTGQEIGSQAHEALLSGKTVELAGNTILLARDGVKHRIADSGAPIRDEDAQIVGAVLVFRDVTEECKLQEKFKLSQKMEALGQLSGGIAHDFNNILTAILGNAQLLAMKLPKESEEASYAKELIKVSVRAADLTRQLLAFSHKENPAMHDIDIHEVVEEVISLLSHSIDPRIEISTSLKAESSTVHADAGQLQNAILNLGVNSRDAMSEGGSLQFLTRNTIVDEEFSRLHSHSISPGLYLELEVTDTGDGIDEETMKHIFEPFFTTKAKEKGTGLGLASVYGCVQNHHGLIYANSEIGKSTTFKILLPIVEAGAQIESEPEIEPAIPGEGRILLVDDEETVRSFASSALQELGYQVITCVDGQEAVEYYQIHYDEIDLVILDLLMPRLDGEETFYRMKEINPDIHALIASGLPQDSKTEALLRNGVSTLLDKPYHIEELSKAIAKYVKVGAI